VFIGDSIVEGYGSSDYNGGATGTSGHLISNNVKTWYRNTGNKCWANKMINYLTETYPNVKACNNAIGGFTTRQIYDNLDTLTLDDDGNRANVAILSIGTNDRYSSNKKVDISYYIIMIIDWLRANQIQPVVLTNTPFLNGTKGNNQEAINRAIIDGCKSADCTCYPLLPSLNRYIWEHNIQVEASSDQTKLLHDELHPSDILYNIMFEMIKEILSI
jgi:lysophospholipase L1-like esterase